VVAVSAGFPVAVHPSCSSSCCASKLFKQLLCVQAVQAVAVHPRVLCAQASKPYTVHACLHCAQAMKRSLCIQRASRGHIQGAYPGGISRGHIQGAPCRREATPARLDCCAPPVMSLVHLHLPRGRCSWSGHRGRPAALEGGTRLGLLLHEQPHSHCGEPQTDASCSIPQLAHAGPLIELCARGSSGSHAFQVFHAPVGSCRSPEAARHASSCIVMHRYASSLMSCNRASLQWRVMHRHALSCIVMHHSCHAIARACSGAHERKCVVLLS
jgi:hypothetical protein